ncbi:MAG TPA: hypothetical protein VF654_16210, partial [Pyrinomonadaceae bacterium]
MRLGRALAMSVTLLVCACAARPAALCVHTPGAGGAAKRAGGGAEMIRPAELFADFPGLRLGMSLREAKAAVEKAGVRPVVSRDETRMTWDGKFDGMDGRATVLFKKGSGVYEVAVLVYAFDKRQEVFAEMSRKIGDRHGDAKEASDT